MAAAAAFTGIVRNPVSSASGTAIPQGTSTSEMAMSGMSCTQIDPNLEHVLPSGITIYGNQEEASQIAAVAQEFPEIWTDQGTTVDIPEDEWMPIPLKPDAISKPSRVYPVS